MGKAAPRKVTADEQAGIAWWNSLTEPERAEALEAVGWKADATDTPSAADAWAVYKERSRAASALSKPLRYIVLLNRNGPPYLFDTETKTKIMSYPTVQEAERQAILLNRFIRPGAKRIAVGDLAKDVDAYFDMFGDDSEGPAP